MISLPGEHGLMINLAWRRMSDMALMLLMMLILTSLDVIANLPIQIHTYSYLDNIRTQATNSHQHIMSRANYKV
jgi:hypothetical protein